MRKRRAENREAHLAYRRSYYERTKDKHAAWNINTYRKRKYGLTPTAFRALWNTQHGRCAVCRTPLVLKRGGYAIDHRHADGRVRGLLCQRCNVLVGHLESVLAEQARQYILGYTAP